MTEDERGQLSYIRPPAEGAGKLLDSIRNGLMSGDPELADEMFGGESKPSPSAEEQKWAMMGLEDTEKRAEFIAAMKKSTADGLRTAAEAQYKFSVERYVKVWSEQPWWWRVTHPKFKPSRHIV